MEFWKNYGILKRKFHIWKNYGIWAKWPYLWKSYGIFVWVEKKVRAFFKKNGGKIRPDFNVCCLGYHFTRPSSTNLPGYSASLSRVNTCWAVNIVRPLSRVRQQVLMSYWLRRWFFSDSRSSPVMVTLPEATQGPSTGNWLSQSVPLLSPPATVSLSQPKSRDTKVIWLCRLCHCTHSAPSSSLDPRLRFNWVPCFVSLRPLRRSTPSAASARMKWGLNGLSRPCHIKCFFTSTIRLRPRLSWALLLSLFSMPDKLSGCRSFRFFPEKFSDFSSLIPIFKKNLRSLVIRR